MNRKMVRKGNKRPREPPVAASFSFNLEGIDAPIGGELVNDTLQDCLAQLEQQSSIPPGEGNIAQARQRKAEYKVLNREKVKIWNESFKEWTRNKSKGNELFPNFDVEHLRHFKIQAISTALIEECNTAGGGLRMPSFERWLIDSKTEEGLELAASTSANRRTVDSVLPIDVSIESEASQRLLEEISQHGSISLSKASKIVTDLCEKTKVAARELVADGMRFSNQAPLKPGDRVELKRHDDNDNVCSIIFHRKKWTNAFCVKINQTHYDKLRSQFLTVHDDSASIQQFHLPAAPVTKEEHRAMAGFHLLLIILLLRYSSLSGGHLLKDLRGGGMQGAIHGEVFEVFRSVASDNGVGIMECFASPLNSYLPQFGSAFPGDIDWHFGSVGNFFSYQHYAKVGGCYQANPPFSPGFVAHMADYLVYQLSLADDEFDTALCFFVIVPTVATKSSRDSIVKRHAQDSFQKMVTSSFCRIHIVLPAREHGYLEGAQHVRPTKHKQSPYDTSVIVLQSRKARQNLKFGEAKFDKEIRIGFISRHDDEIKERKTHELTKNQMIECKGRELTKKQKS